MTNKQANNKGKYLSFLLRHDTEYKFDEHGYRTINDLVTNHGFTFDEIEYIVKTNDKQRYEFNNDKTLIRARQGHSINVNVDLKETVPPNILYHGTARRFIDSINELGILKQTRMYVQLSTDIDTAKNVGQRHGKPAIISIDANAMNKDGIKFYLSNNNVWLTDYVNPKYFISEFIYNGDKIKH